MNYERIKYIGGTLVISLFFIQCTEGSPHISPLGEMTIPDDNQMSEAKIELGRKLFFDKRLSSNETISCASCHEPSKGFTDNKMLSNGVDGRKSMRNSISLLNVGYMHTLMYDAHIESLEIQALVPIKDSNEMNSVPKELIHRLRAIPEYEEAAQEIFDRTFDAWVLTRSLAAFQRTLISDNSKFDQWNRGEAALTEEELNGWKLFSETLYCTHCHPAPHFTSYKAANNGLYEDYSGLEDKGRYRIHGDSSEIGTFKIPSLRNVAITFPYMHDGSLSSLEEVIEHYSKGGKGNPLQSKLIQKITLTSQEKKNLLSFLSTLTDTTYLVDYQ